MAAATIARPSWPMTTRSAIRDWMIWRWQSRYGIVIAVTRSRPSLSIQGSKYLVPSWKQVRVCSQRACSARTLCNRRAVLQISLMIKRTIPGSKRVRHVPCSFLGCDRACVIAALSRTPVRAMTAPPAPVPHPRHRCARPANSPRIPDPPVLAMTQPQDRMRQARMADERTAGIAWPAALAVTTRYWSGAPACRFSRPITKTSITANPGDWE
jgi:hypothetical protein